MMADIKLFTFTLYQSEFSYRSKLFFANFFGVFKEIDTGLHDSVSMEHSPADELIAQIKALGIFFRLK